MIRHGETDYNREGRLQGARDIPLNALGRRQAAQNGQALAALPGFDASRFDWIASPLSRTRETMELLRQGAGLEAAGYRIVPELIEVCFGDWEGFTLADIEAETPGTIAEREAAKWHFRPPGAAAESYEVMAQRVEGFLATLRQPAVIVAHGGTIRSIFQRVAGLPEAEAAMMEIPQDRILQIKGNQVAWL
ncbi:histidine phosphatase family protein [Pseudohoeflea sp. DP4N28-3]|uniref:Histidine phosphatase family protein n=2 Tax=Pseudohoeflea coraliihabitans TaxID=2860393 RepID=A0ABS6WLY2_9HYPH|nr:histidine phosphatase family protein [Pseudohoeflea sp. DP4N28-3]